MFPGKILKSSELRSRTLARNRRREYYTTGVMTKFQCLVFLWHWKRSIFFDWKVEFYIVQHLSLRLVLLFKTVNTCLQLLANLFLEICFQFESNSVNHSFSCAFVYVIKVFRFNLRGDLQKVLRCFHYLV